MLFFWQSFAHLVLISDGVLDLGQFLWAEMAIARLRHWWYLFYLPAASLFACALQRPGQQRKPILKQGRTDYHPDEPGVITCIGDSISRFYPHQLEWGLRLQDDRWYVLNYHQPCTSASGSMDSSAPCGGKPWKYAGNGYELRLALASNPKYVIIMFGTAESARHQFNATEFIAGYGELISMFQALPTSPKVFVMTPPPIDPNNREFPADRIHFNSTIVNSVVQGLVPKVASKHSVTLLDAFEPLGGPKFTRPEYFTKDGVHLSSAGDCAVAAVAFSELMGGRQMDCGPPR